MNPADARYAELLAAGLPGQFCLTWCQSRDLDEVARRFGANVETGLWATPDEIEDLEEEHLGELLQLTQMGEWAIALEPNGFQGIREVVLEPLSLGGRALSVHWNVELDNSVTYAANGTIVTSFDLMDIGQRSGGDPAALDTALAEVDLHDGLPVQTRKARVLALSEKISGQFLTPHWLHSPQLVFVIKEPLPDPIVPPAYLNPRAPFLDEPEFARILTDPSASMVPALTRMVVSIVIAVAAPKSPLVEETLRVLDHGERFPGEQESLRSRLMEQAIETARQATLIRDGSTPGAADEADRLHLAGHALRVLGRALYHSPVEAARAAVNEAMCLRLSSRTDFMRLNVLSKITARIEGDLRRS